MRTSLSHVTFSSRIFRHVPGITTLRFCLPCTHDDRGWSRFEHGRYLRHPATKADWSWCTHGIRTIGAVRKVEHNSALCDRHPPRPQKGVVMNFDGIPAELEQPQISYAAPAQHTAPAVTFSLHWVLAAPALVMEYFAPASVVSCHVPVYTAPAPGEDLMDGSSRWHWEPPGRRLGS